MDAILLELLPYLSPALDGSIISIINGYLPAFFSEEIENKLLAAIFDLSAQSLRLGRLLTFARSENGMLVESDD